MTARIFGPRRTIVGPGFSPTSISAVTGWLRLAERTDTGTLTIPDVLGGPSAVQATAGEKPTFGTANGLPIAILDGSDDNVTQTLATASNNNSPRRGIAFWFNPSALPASAALVSCTINGGGTVNSLLFRQLTSGLAVDAYHNNADSRRGSLASGLSVSTWAFLTLEVDLDQADEIDGCIITIDGVKQSLTFSDQGASIGELPAALQQGTGGLSMGVANVTSNAQPVAGSIGPNIFWLGGAGGISGGGLLTSAQRLALANFDNPTGTPL